MSEDSSVSYGPEMGRWQAFSHEEACLIHHSLRMLATHPLSKIDGPKATKLADEFWALHAAKTEAERDL